MEREEFAWLNQIMDMMEAHFGRDVELVLHDLKKDYTQTIIDIRNGGITGRKIGDGGDNLGLGVIRGTEKNGNKFNYLNYTEDGKTLKSSTLFLRDKTGKPVYALAINEDVTQMWKFEQYLKEKNQSGREADHIVRDVNKLLEDSMEEVQRQIGKSYRAMDKMDKQAYIKFLDERGIFLISKSTQRVCEALQIAKCTLYNYLDLVRKEDED
ncbi:MAG: transcriptional regulator [Lachnospiraceae bacterium]|nr:transcriptional regulator [Lachnospiraceae bacterium]